jgi:hypothetical protein
MVSMELIGILGGARLWVDAKSNNAFIFLLVWAETICAVGVCHGVLEFWLYVKFEG